MLQWRKESVTIIESQEPMEDDNEVGCCLCFSHWSTTITIIITILLIILNIIMKIVIITVTINDDHHYTNDDHHEEENQADVDTDTEQVVAAGQKVFSSS